MRCSDRRRFETCHYDINKPNHMPVKNKVPLDIKHFGQIHCMAYCQDCNWSDEDYVTAGGNGSSHARAFGHRVRVEKGMAYEVRPKQI